MVDKGTETPLHFVEKNIDPSYCWNEWELRKKALQMANIVLYSSFITLEEKINQSSTNYLEFLQDWCWNTSLFEKRLEYKHEQKFRYKSNQA